MPRQNTDVSSKTHNTPATAEINRMIAEAAYYRALARGFDKTDPIDDWLTAEQEIIQHVNGNAS